MKLSVGTKSVLIGAHQFLWHPLLVLLAWRKLYKSWPEWWQFVVIFCHDLGYWGKPDIDGEEGKYHPQGGAALAARIVRFFGGPSWSTYVFSVTHSRDYAAMLELPVSAAYAPDKYSIWFEPAWFYLWRCRLSGELTEYKQHAIDTGHLPAGVSDREWLNFYRNNVINRPDIKKLL